MKAAQLRHWPVWIVVFTVIAETALGGCTMPIAEKKFDGFYMNKARLVLSADPKVYRPCQLETGNHWIVWLTAIQERRGFLLFTEQTQQTIIAIEFDSMPALDETVDLAGAPLQAIYEYGGQRTVYASYSVTGTLRLHANPDNTFSISMNATFHSPVLGDGEQLLNVEMLLRKHPQPDFSE